MWKIAVGSELIEPVSLCLHFHFKCLNRCLPFGDRACLPLCLLLHVILLLLPLRCSKGSRKGEGELLSTRLEFLGVDTAAAAGMQYKIKGHTSRGSCYLTPVLPWCYSYKSIQGGGSCHLSTCQLSIIDSTPTWGSFHLLPCSFSFTTSRIISERKMLSSTAPRRGHQQSKELGHTSTPKHTQKLTVTGESPFTFGRALSCLT